MKDNLVILLAPDSFKESMTAKEVCMAMEKGIKKANPNIKCIHAPMADGGEGSMEALVHSRDGVIHDMEVSGPLGNKIRASYGILDKGKTAIVEMARASGIDLVPRDRRNPLITTTYGTGELIRASLDHGIDKLLIGIGGSATNDGGLGAIQALGGRFLDKNKKELGFGGGELSKLDSIDLSGLDPRLKRVSIDIASDVNNPLCGQDGASYVFGPQKGASHEMVEILDSNLFHYAGVIKKELALDILNLPGAGAAGGLGAALLAFLGGNMRRGVDLVIEYSGLEEKLPLVDMVWTGEGSIDSQTQFGKTPLGVGRIAKKYEKPVLAFAGKLGSDIEPLYQMGIDAFFSINQAPSSLEEALIKGPENMALTAENIIRLIQLGNHSYNIK